MAEEIKAGCARPTGGPVGEKPDVKKENFATTVNQGGEKYGHCRQESTGLYGACVSQRQIH